MSNLTLWEIEKGIAELFDAIDEAELPEERQAAEQALAEYFAREVVKVDRIAGIYKTFSMLAEAARQEAREMAARAATFERRCTSIKEMTAAVFEANPQLGNKLEGRTGRLLYKGNGGLAPLVVTEPADVPDECCKYVGWIDAGLLSSLLNAYGMGRLPESLGKLERVVDNERMRAALKTCEACGGSGSVPDSDPYRADSGIKWKCPACGGSGMGGVPGARLGERGRHVEVK